MQEIAHSYLHGCGLHVASKLGTSGFTLSSDPPHSSLQNQGRYRVNVFQYPYIKDPHLIVLGYLKSFAKQKIDYRPPPPKIVHIIISGTWEHQDVSELTMLREGCLPRPCGWALRAPRGWVLRAPRGEDKVKREAGTKGMLPQTGSTGQPLDAGRGRKESPLGSSEGTGSADTLILDFWAPEMGENTVLFF